MNHQVDHIQHNIIVIPSTLYILYWKVLISLLWPHLITYFTVTTPEWELHHQVLWVLGEICSNCNCSGSQPVSCGVSFSKSQRVSWPPYNSGVTKSWHFYVGYTLKELFACWVLIKLNVSSEVWFKWFQFLHKIKFQQTGFQLHTVYSLYIPKHVDYCECLLVLFVRTYIAWSYNYH